MKFLLFLVFILVVSTANGLPAKPKLGPCEILEVGAQTGLYSGVNRCEDDEEERCLLKCLAVKSGLLEADAKFYGERSLRRFAALYLHPQERLEELTVNALQNCTGPALSGNHTYDPEDCHSYTVLLDVMLCLRTTAVDYCKLTLGEGRVKRQTETMFPRENFPKIQLKDRDNGMDQDGRRKLYELLGNSVL